MKICKPKGKRVKNKNTNLKKTKGKDAYKNQKSLKFRGERKGDFEFQG